MKNIYEKFITLEGGEGSGKTSLGKELKSFLESKGYEVILTREPGGDNTSEQIRKIIMKNKIHPKTEAHLFAAARIEHINNVIIPALKEGKIVICDRYVDSSVVYQGEVLGVENIREINEYAYKNCIPKMSFFFDIAPEYALERLEKNNRYKNRFDQKELGFHKQIYEGYKKLVQEEKRFITIDARVKEKQVLEQVLNYLEY